jgi:hypothetical protein
MAQWIGQFSGNTHATKVAELEASMRAAVSSLNRSGPADDRPRKAKAVRNLAKRLLSARLHLIKSRVVAASEKQIGTSVEALVAREISTRVAGVHGILAEFGVQDDKSPTNHSSRSHRSGAPAE